MTLIEVLNEAQRLFRRQPPRHLVVNYGRGRQGAGANAVDHFVGALEVRSRLARLYPQSPLYGFDYPGSPPHVAGGAVALLDDVTAAGGQVELGIKGRHAIDLA